MSRSVVDTERIAAAAADINRLADTITSSTSELRGRLVALRVDAVHELVRGFRGLGITKIDDAVNFGGIAVVIGHELSHIRNKDMLVMTVAVVLAGFLGGFLLIYRTINSPFGEVLKAIRENEPRAISLGYDVDRYKLLAFVLSTALAGLGGALKTLVLGFATLSDAHWSLSGEVVLMTLLGGMGTFAGPVIGAFTIIGLQNFLSDRVGAWINVIIGVIFVVLVPVAHAVLPRRAKFASLDGDVAPGIRAVPTPGHTKGCTTWTTTLRDKMKPYDVVLVCSAIF